MSKKAKRSRGGNKTDGSKRNSDGASRQAELMSCGVLVVRGDPVEEFLLMVHSDRLDIPKGHVDPGETELQCAYRELEEETGITADDIDLDPDFRFTLEYEVCNKRSGNKPALKRLVVFLGRLHRDVEIQPTEHEDHVWRRWSPPHAIQKKTIDPLLAGAEAYLRHRQEGLQLPETPSLENRRA